MCVCLKTSWSAVPFSSSLANDDDDDGNKAARPDSSGCGILSGRIFFRLALLPYVYNTVYVLYRNVFSLPTWFTRLYVRERKGFHYGSRLPHFIFVQN